MLHITTNLKASSVNGIGLFAAEKILKDTLVWSFCNRFSTLIPRAAFARLPSVQKSFVAHYGWIDKDDPENWRISLDDERFMNHSFMPNLCCDEKDFATRALRTIEAGEELFEDYTEFYFPNEYQPFVAQLLNQRATHA